MFTMMKTSRLCTSLTEKQTPDRHKTSGSERPLLPFDDD
ncbi:hypothetical protein JOC77_003268 [Peribacillus deserti]|uniref:Uncharacterized protein n=1 Tax=Peribacillus deserti TaxID=673318 RepID=A0ABS2QM36_9BACI|nr:hypothetical protein [Peribacillus deserti]